MWRIHQGHCWHPISYSRNHNNLVINDCWGPRAEAAFDCISFIYLIKFSYDKTTLFLDVFPANQDITNIHFTIIKVEWVSFVFHYYQPKGSDSLSSVVYQSLKSYRFLGVGSAFIYFHLSPNLILLSHLPLE